MKIFRLVCAFSVFLWSFNVVSAVILTFPGGGLTGLSSLVLAYRIDQELHNQGYKLADLVDHGVGVSVGAQVATLLLQNNQENTAAKYTSAEAIDVFLRAAPGTFPRLTDITRQFFNSYVERGDMELIAQQIGQGKLRLNFESFKNLFGTQYTSHASFWAMIPALLETVGPQVAFILSEEGRKEQTEILRKKLKKEFGTQKFNDTAYKNRSPFRKLSVIASCQGKPVVYGNRELFRQNLHGLWEAELVGALLNSAAIPLIEERTAFIVQHQKRFVVTDGADAYFGMSPLETVVESSLNNMPNHDVIISLGNGGPFNRVYRKKIGIHDGKVVLPKPKGNGTTTTVLTLEPQVEHWYLASLLAEKGSFEELIQAAMDVPEELVRDAAAAIMANKNLNTREPLPFQEADFSQLPQAMATAKPPEWLELQCKAFIGRNGLVPGIIALFNKPPETPEQIIENVATVIKAFTPIFSNWRI